MRPTVAAGVGCQQHFRAAAVRRFLLPSPTTYLKILNESPPPDSSKVLTFWETLENKTDEVPALMELHSSGKHGRVSVDQSTRRTLW